MAEYLSNEAMTVTVGKHADYKDVHKLSGEVSCYGGSK